MKILFDHQIFQSQIYGGISRYYAEILPRLCAHPDVSVSLFLGRSVNKYDLEKHKSKFDHFWGRPVNDWELKTGTYTKLNRLQLPFFTALSRPEIIHFTYYRDTNPFFKGRRVVTVYDMIHELHPSEFGSKDATTAWKKKGVEKSDIIISISESTKRDLIQLWGVSPEKIKVIHLANSLFVTPGKHPLAGRPYVLFVGLRRGYKNFSKLLQSLARLKMPELHLVSYGGAPFSFEEQQEIHRFGLSERVHYRTGDDQTLATFYKHALVFVFPTTYEGFGIPPLEAMQYDCPVITSNQSSIPEVVGEGGLLVDTNSVDELQIAIEKVVQDSQLRQMLIGKGRLQTRKFSWDRCAQEHLQVYKELG